MKNKRVIVWALLFALSAGLISGCGSSQNPTGSQPLPETIPATTAPTEPTQPLPPQTESSTYPCPSELPPILLELDQRTRYEINTFLSYFSEQWFHEEFDATDDAPNDIFYAETGNIAQIVDFVWLYAKLNHYTELRFVNKDDRSYYAFDLDLLSPIAERFFGRTLTEASLENMESAYYVLLDGMVCGPAADGETYTNISVTDRMHDLGDGTMLVEFTIYDTWAFSDLGGIVPEKELYYLTGEEAQENPDLVFHLNGTAVVRPHTLEDGRESYRLVSYKLYDPIP